MLQNSEPPNMAAYGAILRYCFVCYLSGFGKPLSVNLPFFAEAMAVNLSIKITAEKGWNKFWLEIVVLL